MLNNFEKQSGVPKVYVFLGLVALYSFLIFFNIGGEFLVNFAGFIVPGYYSLEALFSTGKSDDTQWLTVSIVHSQGQQLTTWQYWVVYAFLNVFESLINAVYWFRMYESTLQITGANCVSAFYYTFKFVFVLWMALPMTNGAQIVFRSIIQPVFSRFFSQSGSTSADLRGKADSAMKSQ